MPESESNMPIHNANVVETSVDITNEREVKEHVTGRLLRGLNMSEEAAIGDLVELRETTKKIGQRPPKLKNSLARFLMIHLHYGHELNIRGDIDNGLKIVTIEGSV
jgi:hypothetical protein